MNTPRPIADVWDALVGHERVGMSVAAHAAGITRGRLVRALRESGVDPRAMDTKPVSIANVIGALLWIADHETVLAAARRVGWPVRQLWEVLVDQGVIVPSPDRKGMRWYRLRPSDVDAALVAVAARSQATRDARDAARAPMSCVVCSREILWSRSRRRGTEYCSVTCRGVGSRTIDHDAVVADVEAGMTHAEAAERNGAKVQTVANIMCRRNKTFAEVG